MASKKRITVKIPKPKARHYLIDATIRLTDLDNPNWALATSLRAPYRSGSLKKSPLAKRKMFADALRQFADLVEKG